MSEYELSIAQQVIAKIKPSEYVSYNKVVAKVGEIKGLYKVWTALINEGYLVQGYLNLKNNPQYKLA